MTQAYNILGLIGMILLAVSLFKETYTVFKNKNAGNHSKVMLGAYVIGLILTLIYGFGESLWPVYIMSIIGLVFSLLLLALSMCYGKADSGNGYEVPLSSNHA